MTPCPQPIKRIIFIDWDDTLLPTSWLKSQGYEVDKPILKPELLNAQIEHVYDKVSALLELYRQYGYVYIITNSETGWVDLSISAFAPKLSDIIGGLEIVSARSTFEPDFPDDPMLWKYLAMRDIIFSHMMDSLEPVIEIVSVGDDMVEREAAMLICKQLVIKTCKTIKLLSRPTSEQLVNQLNLLCTDKCVRYIFRTESNLDISLVVSEN